jgi:hypothetical protein
MTSTSSVSAIKTQLSNGQVGASVLSRGNPGQSSLALTSLNETHYYFVNSTNFIDISTIMVENAVYEVMFDGMTGGVGIKPSIAPNYNSYTNAFTSTYFRGIDAAATGYPTVTGNPGFFTATTSQFAFENYNGAVGSSPCGKMVIFNVRGSKMVMYHGGDTRGVCIGNSQWNDTTTQWTNVGRLNMSASVDRLRVWVRRLA